MIGGSAPSAGRPDASRLNQMFGQTVNRCQATPMVVFSPSTTNQAIEMMILTADTTTMAVASAVGRRPAGSRNQVSGKCAGVVSAPSSWYSSARSTSTQTTMPRMISSTKTPCQVREPKNRDAPAPAPEQPADQHQHDDRDQPGPGDDLAGPLVDHPVTDHRQREPGVEQLPVRGDQGEEQRPERDEDEPVRRPRPPVHCSIRV